MGIQMKQKELTETFMLILNRKKPFDLHGLNKNVLELKGLIKDTSANTLGLTFLVFTPSTVNCVAAHRSLYADILVLCKYMLHMVPCEDKQR